MTSSKKQENQDPAKVKHGAYSEEDSFPRMSLQEAKELGLTTDPVLIVSPQPRTDLVPSTTESSQHSSNTSQNPSEVPDAPELPPEPKLKDFPDEESFLEARDAWRHQVLPIKRLAAIMHHGSLFCTPGCRTHAGDPSVWIGVRQLAVQHVWG